MTFYRDVEGIDTPIGLVERLYRDVSESLSTGQRNKGRFRALMQQLAGAEIPWVGKLPEVVAPHWKALLETTIEDLIEAQPGHRIVLFWDEFPLMLRKFQRGLGDALAMEVLDTLRGLRQMHSGLRMVFTGSIGLHHVTSSLRELGHANDATNDMRTFEVPPLTPEDARKLATALLEGEGLSCTDPDRVAAEIASGVDGIPYYIHHVISQLEGRSGEVSPQRVRDVVTHALVDPQDTWHLQHYRERLDDYYGTARVPVALALLDELATASDALSFDHLHKRLGSQLDPDTSPVVARILGGDREDLRRLLRLMQRDHYVEKRPEDGRFQVRFPLIRRWWVLDRNLGA